MARKRKRNGSAEDEGPLFVEGTPVDAFGAPLNDAEISAEEAKHMPLDSEGSRYAAEYQKAVSRKSSGEKGVPFNAPDPVKYNAMFDIHPEARVRIYQLEPEVDHSFGEKHLSQIRTYELMRSHIVQDLWNGERAVFRWEVHGGRYPFASGNIQLREDEMRRYGHGQQPPAPYGTAPYPPQMPPPYGVPPMQGYAPPPVFIQQQPQQQQPQQQAPPPMPAPPPIQLPPGLDPTIGALLTTLITQLNDANARNAALTAQQYYAQPAAAPQVQMPPPPPPPPPKGPIEQLNEMSAMLTQVNSIRDSLVNTFGGGGDSEPETPPPPQSDPDFPTKVKDFGPVRMIANADGEVTAPLLMNLDKYEGLFDGLLGKVKKLFSDISEDRMRVMREQVHLMQQAEAISNRASQQKTLQGHEAPQPQMQQQQPHVHQTPNWQPPSVPVAPQPEQSPPEHPWEKFSKPRVAPQETPPPAPIDPPVDLPVLEAEVVESPAEVAD